MPEQNMPLSHIAAITPAEREALRQEISRAFGVDLPPTERKNHESRKSLSLSTALTQEEVGRFLKIVQQPL
ncbi:MAG: hypothetical protein HQL54_03080 [Magnetococcales bacterium]|nr:hypothetical protein [Magnetococcales bacterium]